MVDETINAAAEVVESSLNWRNIIIGIFGLALIIYGTLLPVNLTQKELFLFGSVFLLVSSSLEKHWFFAILQIVVLAGSAIAFLPVDIVVKSSLPIVLSIFAISYFALQGMLREFLNIVGVVGLIFLALGYAISNPIVYLLGGVFLAWYSYLSYRQGAKIAMVFFILNIAFSISSVVGVYHLLW